MGLAFFWLLPMLGRMAGGLVWLVPFMILAVVATNRNGSRRQDLRGLVWVLGIAFMLIFGGWFPGIFLLALISYYLS